MLFAGEGAIGGPARYRLSVLTHLTAEVTRLVSSEWLSARVAARRYDAIILSAPAIRATACGRGALGGMSPTWGKRMVPRACPGGSTANHPHRE